MLHDIWTYKFGDCPDHGPRGALEAEKILSALGSFSREEINSICEAIARHSDKGSIDGELAELLKDADVFQHYLYNPQLFVEANRPSGDQNDRGKSVRLQRLEKVLKDLEL